MATKQRPTTVDEYIAAAPAAGQPHLRQIHALLKSVAPHAEEAIKWGNPFFIEPRFLFAYSAYKAHLSFAPTAKAMEAFGDRLKKHETVEATKGTVKLPYAQPLPEALIREMAEFCVRELREREGDSFW